MRDQHTTALALKRHRRLDSPPLRGFTSFGASQSCHLHALLVSFVATGASYDALHASTSSRFSNPIANDIKSLLGDQKVVHATYTAASLAATFDLNEQQDPVEVLEFLADQSPRNEPLFDNLRLELVTSAKCTLCDHVVRPETTTCMTFKVPVKDSIRLGIVERLDSSLQCDCCHEETMTQSCIPVESPPVIYIELIAFDDNGSRIDTRETALNAFLQFPPESGPVYVHAGGIIHLGTGGRGHFVSYVFDRRGKILLYSDEDRETFADMEECLRKLRIRGIGRFPKAPANLYLVIYERLPFAPPSTSSTTPSACSPPPPSRSASLAAFPSSSSQHSYAGGLEFVSRFTANAPGSASPLPPFEKDDGAGDNLDPPTNMHRVSSLPLSSLPPPLATSGTSTTCSPSSNIAVRIDESSLDFSSDSSSTGNARSPAFLSPLPLPSPSTPFTQAARESVATRDSGANLDGADLEGRLHGDVSSGHHQTLEPSPPSLPTSFQSRSSSRPRRSTRLAAASGNALIPLPQADTVEGPFTSSSTNDASTNDASTNDASTNATAPPGAPSPLTLSLPLSTSRALRPRVAPSAPPSRPQRVPCAAAASKKRAAPEPLSDDDNFSDDHAKEDDYLEEEEEGADGMDDDDEYVARSGGAKSRGNTKGVTRKSSVKRVEEKSMAKATRSGVTASKEIKDKKARGKLSSTKSKRRARVPIASKIPRGYFDNTDDEIDVTVGGAGGGGGEGREEDGIVKVIKLTSCPPPVSKMYLPVLRLIDAEKVGVHRLAKLE